MVLKQMMTMAHNRRKTMRPSFAAHHAAIPEAISVKTHNSPSHKNVPLHFKTWQATYSTLQARMGLFVRPYNVLLEGHRGEGLPRRLTMPAGIAAGVRTQNLLHRSQCKSAKWLRHKRQSLLLFNVDSLGKCFVIC